jgi:hypothetical protein
MSTKLACATKSIDAAFFTAFLEPYTVI